MAKTLPKKNVILSRLASSDLGLLEPHLEPVDLPVRKVLERRGRKITAVYMERYVPIQRLVWSAIRPRRAHSPATSLR